MQKQWSKKFGIVKSYFSGRVGWVGGWGGWLEKSRVRLSHLPTKLKLKLKMSLAIFNSDEQICNLEAIQMHSDTIQIQFRCNLDAF